MILETTGMFLFAKVPMNKYKITTNRINKTNMSSPGPDKLVGATL